MKKFENFKATLVNLKDIFSYQEPYGNSKNNLSLQCFGDVTVDFYQRFTKAI